jgi:DNA polymerase-3 subunit epsilon
MDAAEVLPRDLVFVDLETTGGNAAYHRITEVGILRLQNGELAEEWSSLVNPECPIPPFIEDFTGITNQMVSDAPRFADIAALVREKLEGDVFVAHNARFDYSFLRSEFRRLGMNFSAKVLCTVKLSRRLFPQFARHNLDAVMERHGIVCSSRHRALGDARVLHDLWSTLRREVPHAVLAQAVHTVLGAHRLPAHLPADFADDLPDGPGVYRFHGEDDAVLYIGMSNSLRTRVLTHLAGEHSGGRQQRLARQVRRLEWQATAGELGAKLLEARWIKTQQPLHNRRLKDTGDSFTLRIPAAAPGTAGECGCPIQITAIDGHGTAALAQCFGVFHSAKDARKALIDIARAHQLCLKCLGMEQSAGSCFAYQIGKCKGACVGKEPLMLHNLRLNLALSSLKLKPWPFPGRIALRERGAPDGALDGGLGPEFHVLDHWTYLGTARSEAEIAAFGAERQRADFDADVYRILVRHFSNHPKLEWRDLRDLRDPTTLT